MARQFYNKSLPSLYLCSIPPKRERSPLQQQHITSARRGKWLERWSPLVGGERDGTVLAGIEILPGVGRRGRGEARSDRMTFPVWVSLFTSTKIAHRGVG